jgi:hypothetical protein
MLPLFDDKTLYDVRLRGVLTAGAVANRYSLVSLGLLVTLFQCTTPPAPEELN